MAATALTPEQKEALAATANAIAAPGKGILAADESTGTIGKRFATIKLENTEENRRAYRELLFSTEKLSDAISGVIMYEETLFQKHSDGTPFPEVLKKQGIITGIKTDKGMKNLLGTYEETTTQGLDDMDVRCKKYYEHGARFAKWRCALRIDVAKGLPSTLAINENAWILARYASISQMCGLVPIVEPEILMDGDHDLAVAVRVAEDVLAACYKALADQHVYLEGTLLKPNMVCPGQDCKIAYSPSDVGLATLTVMQRRVPVSVPGVTFLSGGLSEEDATVYLNAMNKVPGKKPWSLTFSFGRALQATVLKTWQGKKENVPQAQAALYKRASANGLAQQGRYESSDANGASKESLFQKNYKY